MMGRGLFITEFASALLLCASLPSPAFPSPLIAEPQSVPPAPQGVAAARAGEDARGAPDGALLVPALTPVIIALRAHLGSKISTSGDWFEIELAEPVMVDGRLALPAGTRGLGEVVHAKKSGGSGASGELVLAARYLDIGGRRLRLRSMRFAEAGADAIGTVNALNVASAASPVPGIGLIGFFIKGKGIDLPEGTRAHALTAEAFGIDPATPDGAGEVMPAQTKASEEPPDGGMNEKA